MSFAFMKGFVLALVNFDECWRLLLLGIIQGITEFLPISSTAHIKVISVILGWGDPGVAVSAFIQIGSVIAVITYFWGDLLDVLAGISKIVIQRKFRDSKKQLSMSIVVGTIPIIFVGVLVKLFWSGYETSPLRSLPSIAFVSIVMAFFLAIAEKFGSRTKTEANIKISDGFQIGLAQALAIFPGVSRSGITITAALLQGWERDSAARFCFLLGIPAITLSALAEIKGALAAQYSGGLVPLLLGVLSAAITSWLAIDFLLKFLRSNTTMIFVWYRLIFGILIFSWWYLFV